MILIAKYAASKQKPGARIPLLENIVEVEFRKNDRRMFTRRNSLISDTSRVSSFSQNVKRHLSHRLERRTEASWRRRRKKMSSTYSEWLPPLTYPSGSRCKKMVMQRIWWPLVSLLRSQDPLEGQSKLHTDIRIYVMDLYKSYEVKNGRVHTRKICIISDNFKKIVFYLF